VDTIARLSTAETVDGLALFGSQASVHNNPVSDYDLLILIEDAPVDIFQMFTHIDGRAADIVFVETQIADRVLTLDAPVKVTYWEQMFVLKMLKARIVYDRSGRLGRVQEHVIKLAQSPHWMPGSTDSEAYAAWFWQNHTLAHVKRMYQSDDPIYVTSADMMLMGALADVCRAYFQCRHLAWEGEKAAIRYLQVSDAGYLDLLRECLSFTDRQRRLALYERLAAQAIAPVGSLWEGGVTAVYLKHPDDHPAQVPAALDFWERLLHGH
jgi:hypothetical protein